MKIGRTRNDSPDGMQTRIVVADEAAEVWFDVRRAERLRLERAGATRSAAARIAGAVMPGSLSEALAAGEAFTDAARAAIGVDDARVDGEVPLTNALDPSGYRDCMVFERHFSFGYKWQGRPVPDVLYEIPIAYLGNPASFLGPDDTIPWPHYTERLDYELELGIVIGRAGTQLTPEQAIDHVVGLTILNDVSARDIQAREMAGNLGPCKGKHFACVTGPYVTTLDELPWESGLRMQARVNGETWCDASSSEAIWSIGEIVAWASQGEMLQPGQLLGTGTCNGGSGVEIDRWLAPADRLEFEIQGLGILANTIGTPASGGWWPEARTPSRAPHPSA